MRKAVGYGCLGWMVMAGLLAMLTACADGQQNTSHAGQIDSSEFADAVTPPSDLPCRVAASHHMPPNRTGKLIEGTVRLTSIVDTNGRIVLAIITQGSGNPMLDTAAREQVLNTTCAPYVVDGTAHRAVQTFRIKYRIEPRADVPPLSQSAAVAHATDTTNGNVADVTPRFTMPVPSAIHAAAIAQSGPQASTQTDPSILLLQHAVEAAALNKFGIAPGSTKAAIIERWGKRIASDPDVSRFRGESLAHSQSATISSVLHGQSGVNALRRLTPEDRNTLLNVTTKALDHEPDCSGGGNTAAALTHYLFGPDSSDEDLDSFMRVGFSLLKNSALNTPPASITDEQRKESMQQVMHALGKTLQGDPQGLHDVAEFMVNHNNAPPVIRCKVVRLYQHALQATPQPYRDWAMINIDLLADAQGNAAGNTVGNTVGNAQRVPESAQMGGYVNTVSSLAGVYSSTHSITIDGVKVQTHGYIEIDHVGRITAFEQEGEGPDSVGSGCYLLAAGTATNAGLQGRILTRGVSPQGDIVYQTPAGDDDTFGILAAPATNGGMRWFFHGGSRNNTITINGNSNVVNSSNQTSYSISTPALASPTSDQLRSMLCRADK